MMSNAPPTVHSRGLITTMLVGDTSGSGLTQLQPSSGMSRCTLSGTPGEPVQETGDRDVEDEVDARVEVMDV